jgi:integrase/recombinase XerD
MPQASVLSDADIRRVFRVIETTRYAERNRVAFMLSIYAGMRVGEIAAIKVSDVINQYGEVRSEIKLAANQTKGFGPPSVCDSSQCKGRRHEDDPAPDGPSAH